MGRGGTRIGIGGGWSRRTFIAPTGTPGFNVNGTSDQSFYAQVFGSTDVGRNGSFSASAFGSYYDTDIAGAEGVMGWGANTAYTHRFGPLSATASAGIFGFDNKNSTTTTSNTAAQALLGLRYGF